MPMNSRCPTALALRATPTAEDTEIFQRHMARIVRWHRTINPQPGQPISLQLVGAISRGCCDYLEFVPRSLDT